MSPKNLNASKKTHNFLFNKLKDKRTLQIYKKFESELGIKSNFIVAVSGGPDSLALSFLAKIYSKILKIIDPNGSECYWNEISQNEIDKKIKKFFY